MKNIPSYKALPEHLHSTADASITFFKKQFGIKKVQIEKPVDPSIAYSPTLTGETNDHYTICIDVSEKIFNPTKIYFIHECQKLFLPVKYYVIIPKDTMYAEYMNEFKRAKSDGIGIIEIDPVSSDGSLLNHALCLSLTCLRPFKKNDYPPKYRSIITSAEETYKNGDPNKACSNIYDEIEDITRKIATKTYSLNMWKQVVTNPATFTTEGWSKIINLLEENLDRKKYPDLQNLNSTLLSSIKAITKYRNESNHKPSNKSKIIKRDEQLRTRMEAALDLLYELCTACKKVKKISSCIK